MLFSLHIDYRPPGDVFEATRAGLRNIFFFSPFVKRSDQDNDAMRIIRHLRRNTGSGAWGLDQNREIEAIEKPRRPCPSLPHRPSAIRRSALNKVRGGLFLHHHHQLDSILTPTAINSSRNWGSLACFITIQQSSRSYINIY